MQYFFWELRYGTNDNIHSIFVPPDKVATIRARWDSGKPLHLSVGTVPTNQIKSFEITDRPYITKQAQLATGELLDDAAKAFDSAVEYEVQTTYYKETVVKARWVKQTTTQDKWAKHYLPSPGYHKLTDDGAMVVMAFPLPVHKINPLVTPYCTEDEIKFLTTK